MSQEQLQALINTFCSTVEAHGYYPVVYSSKNMFQNKIGDIKYDKWVAQYADALEYEGASYHKQRDSLPYNYRSTASKGQPRSALLLP